MDVRRLFRRANQLLIKRSAGAAVAGAIPENHHDVFYRGESPRGRGTLLPTLMEAGGGTAGFSRESHSGLRILIAISATAKMIAMFVATSNFLPSPAPALD